MILLPSVLLYIPLHLAWHLDVFATLIFCFNNIDNVPSLVKYVYKWVFFFKYWKNIPTLFYLDACIDPRVKVEDVENILNFIANWINQQSQPKGKEYKQLNISYK